MPRQIRTVEDLIQGKIRKRGCSSSASSSSSVVHNYRIKKAVLVGRRGGSSTPVPTWRLISSRSPSVAMRGAESPKYTPSLSGRSKIQAPVSARKLAATLWEMNEIPSPSLRRDGLDERRLRREARGRERMARLVHASSLPPHLSDPSHSPSSERMDRSGTGSRRRAPPATNLLNSAEPNIIIPESLSNSSLMEMETRSRAQTPHGSTTGVKTRLKDVSNALTTSKELLKIVNRIWGHEDRPQSNMSLISALHAELERARLLVNQLIQEQRSDQNEISYLMKRFAEEKAAWKSKEQEVVEAAVESVVGELEVERKLRRRSESLNKKLGRELAEARASLLKAVKELESEKRVREVMEQVCDELAENVDSEKRKAEDEKRESARIQEEVAKEKEMMQLADVLHEERAQLKRSGAKYPVAHRNAAIDKLRNQLEAFLGCKRSKGKKTAASNYPQGEEIPNYGIRSRPSIHHENEHEDGGEVVDGVESKEDSLESELHSIELDSDNRKSYKWAYAHGTDLNSRRDDKLDKETKSRRSTSEKMPRRSTALLRTASDGVEWGSQDQGSQIPINELVWDKSQEQGYLDEVSGYKLAKDIRDRIYSGSVMGSPRALASPTRQWGQLRSSRDPAGNIPERPPVFPGSAGKSRLADTRSEALGRRSKR